MVTRLLVTHLHKIAQECTSSNTSIIHNPLILTNFHTIIVIPEGFFLDCVSW